MRPQAAAKRPTPSGQTASRPEGRPLNGEKEYSCGFDPDADMPDVPGRGESSALRAILAQWRARQVRHGGLAGGDLQLVRRLRRGGGYGFVRRQRAVNLKKDGRSRLRDAGVSCIFPVAEAGASGWVREPSNEFLAIQHKRQENLRLATLPSLAEEVVSATVEIRLIGGNLANTMSEMRMWLDHGKLAPQGFRQSTCPADWPCMSSSKRGAKPQLSPIFSAGEFWGRRHGTRAPELRS